jgi:hypothetical protein
MVVEDRLVLAHSGRSDDFLRTHEGFALMAIGEAIARLKHCRFGGLRDASRRYSGDVYLVPDGTLPTADARRLGIASARDLFGGVVPYSFVKTKAITHPVVGDAAERPEGWSETFTARIRNVVLPGYTAFSAGDASEAVTMLRAEGSVRVKNPLAAGGQGQRRLVTDADAASVLENLPVDQLHEYGLVFETDLTDVTTLSIGQVVLDDLTVTYYGTQRLTTDNDGRSAYGGSDLVCARGSWNALDRLSLPQSLRQGIAQARVYDEATSEYPGFMASRRNYDVAQGLDSRGHWRSGVLEASWRVGGATGAEVAAMEVFSADASVDLINASSVVAFGDNIEPPQGAWVHFQGDDPVRGPMIQYALATRVPPQPA